jgi:hypothetical protein
LPLQRVVSDFGFEKSFEKTARSIREHHGFELPLSAVAAVTREQASTIALKQTEGTKSANALPAVGGAEQIIAEADGSFVRIVSTAGTQSDSRKNRKVDYREARLCASSRHGCDSTRYDATFEPVESVGLMWAQTAKMAGMSMKSHVHVLADGATWIDAQRSVAFGKQGELLIDLYHVLEYLGDASAQCSRKPKQWLKTQKRRLKAGRSDRVINELKKNCEPPSEPDEASPVRRAWRYLKNRRNHLAYDKAIERDLPIGSGLIESGNKHVLQARLKIAGASWNIVTAENFARARAMRANNMWDQYWQELKKTA